MVKKEKKTNPQEIPPLRRLADAEVGYIKSQFNLYDTHKSGTIAKHLAKKILENIGVEPSVISLPNQVGFLELIMFIDSKLPEPDPALEASLFTFSRMVGELNEDGMTRVVRPQAIIDFLTTLDRPAPTLAEATLLLTSMQDYDNVDRDTKVNSGKFSHELMSFNKKSNALREFR